LRADVISQQLIAHLMDAHASEEQSLGLLRRARRSCSREGLLEVHDEHLSRAERHRRLLEDRLDAHGAKPSALKDAAMRLGALNLSSVFQAQAATPGKAPAVLFALTHSKMAGYELLRSVARRASDAATVEVTEQMLAEERESAARLSASFDEAVEAGIDGPDPSGNVFGDLRRTLASLAERTRLGSVQQLE
jgi:ferritin-like metal-binding protein YciE